MKGVKNKKKMAGIPVFYSETITPYYKIFLFLFVVLGIFAIYKLLRTRRCLSKGSLRDSISWLSASVVWFVLWSIDHIFHDLVPLPSHLILFFHYVVSHGFLLVLMVFIVVSAFKFGKVYKELPAKFRAKAKKK